MDILSTSFNSSVTD